MSELPTLLVDRRRVFADGRPTEVARDPEAAIQRMRERHLAGGSWDQVWFGYDLGTTSAGAPIDTMPVVDWMCECAFDGDPVRVETIYLHTSNPDGGAAMFKALLQAGYHTVRTAAAGMITDPLLLVAGDAR